MQTSLLTTRERIIKDVIKAGDGFLRTFSFAMDVYANRPSIKHCPDLAPVAGNDASVV
jgi:hypothetical protein